MANTAVVEKNSSVAEEEKTQKWQETIDLCLLYTRCTTRLQLVSFLLDKVNDIRTEMSYDLE